jgi:1-acyl-sn-glycerol-3-phosphate acyltransferase
VVVIQELCFKALRWVSDRWVNKHCKILYFGEENIADNKDERRIYISNHPTTFDVPALLSINEKNIYTLIDSNAYTIPFLGLLLRGAGFIKFAKGKGREALEKAQKYIEEKKPFVQTLRTGEAIVGEKSRPRIGGIVLAHASKANLYPLFVMIEEGKKVLKYFRGIDLKKYPYTFFHETLYFIRFGKPIRYEEYAKENMTHRDFIDIANRISDLLQKEKAALQKILAEKKEYYAGLPRAGGPEYRLVF